MLKDCPVATKLSQVVPDGLSSEIWAWYVQDKLFSGQLREAVVVLELKILYEQINEHSADGNVLARALTQDYKMAQREIQDLTGGPVIYNYHRAKPPVLKENNKKPDKMDEQTQEFEFGSSSPPL